MNYESLRNRCSGTSKEIAGWSSKLEFSSYVIAVLQLFVGIIMGVAIKGVMGGIVFAFFFFSATTTVATLRILVILIRALSDIVSNTEMAARAAIYGPSLTGNAKSSNSISSVAPSSKKAESSTSAPSKRNNNATKLRKCENCGRVVNCTPCPHCGTDTTDDSKKTSSEHILFKCPQCARISKTIPCSNCGYEATEFIK